MKILSIATTYPRWIGDSEPAFVHLLNKELRRRGHGVTALVPHAESAPRLEIRDGVDIKRFRYFIPTGLQRLCYDGGIMPSLARDPIAWINLPVFLALLFLAIRREVRCRNYDVVHCHWLIPQGFFCVLLRRTLGFPLVISAHGGDVFTENAPFRLLNAVVCRSSAALTANSRGSKERMVKLGAGEDVRLIPMGVDIDSFCPSRREPAIHERMGGGGPQLLFVGRFAEKKGIKYSIGAMPLIIERLPGAKLALVGFGPLEKELTAEIRKHDLEQKIKILGRVEAERMPVIMASADLFILPSIMARSGDTEGLGVVILEAMASEVPVVATSVGGITDIVVHEDTGLLCSPKDVHSLADACVRMCSDDVLRERCRKTARRRVERNYSWSAVGRRFEELFLKL